MDGSKRSGWFAGATVVAIGCALAMPASSWATPAEMAPQSSQRTTFDGWNLTVALSGEVINAVPNLAGAQNSREAFMTLSAQANIGGNGSNPVTAANFVAGYQVGCQIDVSQGLQIGGVGRSDHQRPAGSTGRRQRGDRRLRTNRPATGRDHHRRDGHHAGDGRRRATGYARRPLEGGCLRRPGDCALLRDVRGRQRGSTNTTVRVRRPLRPELGARHVSVQHNLSAWWSRPAREQHPGAVRGHRHRIRRPRPGSAPTPTGDRGAAVRTSGIPCGHRGSTAAPRTLGGIRIGGHSESRGINPGSAQRFPWHLRSKHFGGYAEPRPLVRSRRHCGLHQIGRSTTIPGTVPRYSPSGVSTTWLFARNDEALRSTGPFGVCRRIPTWVTSSPPAVA